MRNDIYEVIFMENKENGRINYSKIARQYECDPRTVKRYFLERLNDPTTRKKRVIAKLTDGFEEIIEQKFIDCNAPAISIFNLLKEKYSYKGSYQTIKKYVHLLKDKKINEATVRFETIPGLQAQVDWKEELRLTDKFGKLYIVNVFLCILGYSRLKYIQLTLDRSQPTLFNCLANSFKYFKGVPEEILFDNMRTVVDRARTQFNKVAFNQRFYMFSTDAGFTPKSCVAYRPRTKGKVEVVAKIMNRLKAYNNEFSSYEELEKITTKLMDDINNEIHQTTLQKPFERYKKEKNNLKPEPNYDTLSSYFKEKELTRKVPKDCLVVYENNKYSVPLKYMNKLVSIKRIDNNLYIYHENLLVCAHKINQKKFNYLEEHYKELANKTFGFKDSIDEICKNNLRIFDNL